MPASEPDFTSVSEFRGREVACWAIGPYFDALRERGLPAERLTRNLGVSAEYLADATNRISWTAYATLLENAQALWSDEELVALGRRAAVSRWFRPFADIARLRYGPLDLYRWLVQRGAGVQRQALAAIAYTLEELGPDHLEVRVHVAPGYPVPRGFLLGAQGTLAAIPTILGYEPARIEMKPAPGGARYEIRLPPRRPALGWLRKVLGWPFAVRRAAVFLEEAYESLNQSSRQYAAIFNATSDAIVINDLEGAPLDANPAAWRLFGYGREEFLAVDPMQLVDLGSREAYRRYLEAVREGRQVQFEQTATRKDGSRVDLEIRGAPIEFRGRPAALGVIRDVTDRKRSEAERIRLEEQLLQAQKMEAVGQLAGGIAHDFNNLLSVITGYAGLLLESADGDGGVLEAAGQIRLAADRGAALTRQLLAFSRGAVVEPEALRPNALILELKKMLERLIGDDVELVLDLDEGVGWIRADASQIEQAIVNLVVNARDAMPGGGRLAIATRSVLLGTDFEAGSDFAPGPYACIRVADTGHGMGPEVQARIFEPFFTTKERGRGSGLGLSTVFGIVRQSGGYVRVESAPGAGARFDLYLPLVEAPGEPARPLLAAAELVARPGETVLLVEDEPMLRQLTRASLESRGFTVLAAARGAEALALAEGHGGRLDLVVADVVMPEMSGVELAERVRARLPQVRILLVSGHSEVVAAGRLPPGVHFLAKPFRQDELVREIRRVLDRD